MLGMANKPEYYRYEDQEVQTHKPHPRIYFCLHLRYRLNLRGWPESRRSVFSSFILPSSYSIACFPRTIWKKYMISEKSFQTSLSPSKSPCLTTFATPNNAVNGLIYSSRSSSTFVAENQKSNSWARVIQEIWFTRFWNSSNVFYINIQAVEEKFKDVDLEDLEEVVLAPVPADGLANLAADDDPGQVGSMDEISKRPRSPRKRALDEELDNLASSHLNCWATNRGWSLEFVQDIIFRRWSI